jgi:hypothetical protein
MSSPLRYVTIPVAGAHGGRIAGAMMWNDDHARYQFIDSVMEWADLSRLAVRCRLLEEAIVCAQHLAANGVPFAVALDRWARSNWTNLFGPTTWRAEHAPDTIDEGLEQLLLLIHAVKGPPAPASPLEERVAA